MTLWEVFVWMFWFYIVVSCLVIFFTAIVDIFRDHTLSGWAKALWLLFIVVLPFLGVLIYLVVRGHSMTERRMAESMQARAETDSYIRDVAGTATTSPATEIEKGKQLLDAGAISQAEYDALKAKTLAGA